MDAMQRLARTRKTTIMLFLFMVWAFFLLHGLFGYFRGHAASSTPEPGVNKALDGNVPWGHP